ncbi:hypothetical protein K488DRAFT_88788 [Vararia minispora EC-137]|uniref:Uncharacterized protein n=1 Tax=Vararia minispora EC-137 TaxID=1314806 RepID=A0ACB8QC66_9AGAM|nr:hypothetical protein K488DRAFT_88788 [Vararia minispora EC-137]
MSGRPRHFDKEVYERAYKKSFRGAERDHNRAMTPGTVALASPVTLMAASRQPDAFRDRGDPRAAELRSRTIAPIPATPSPPAQLYPPVPQQTLRHTNKALPLSSSPATSDAWVGIFEKDDDFEVKTMDLRSLAPAESLYTIQVQPPSTRSAALATHDRLGPSVQRRDNLLTPSRAAEKHRMPLALDQHHAGKQRIRSSSDAYQPLALSGPPPIAGQPMLSISRTHAADKVLRHPVAASGHPRAPSPPPPRSSRETRANHVRSSSDRPRLVTAAPVATWDRPVTSGRDAREQHLSDMKPRIGLVSATTSSRPRAALPGQWTVDAKNTVPGARAPIELSQGGKSKPRASLDKVLPSTPRVDQPVPTHARVEAQSRRRHHSPPPARQVHRDRPRRSSFDDGAYARPREGDRDRDRHPSVDQPSGRRESGRAAREATREQDRNPDRDPVKERRRQERRARRHTADDWKSSLWLRESTFDASMLPPGDLPLPASYLPPKPPHHEYSSRSLAQKTRPRATTDGQQIHAPPQSSSTRAYGPTLYGPSSPVPHLRHPGVPLAPVPSSAATSIRPPLFTGESRWREDFDAKTLPASIFSLDNPRSRSTPPEELTPARGFARKLRKRPPELPKLSLDACSTPSGPLSPPLLSPASGGSDKSRFGSLPRMFMPHRWLGR